MKNGVWKKIFIMSIVLLFIETSMISTTNGSIVERYTKTSVSSCMNPQYTEPQGCNPTNTLNFPPSIPVIDPVLHYGLVGIESDLSATSVDPDGEDVYYLIDWGNGNYSDWFGPFHSGVTITFVHIFNAPGLYHLKVKSNDTSGDESNWSEMSFFYIYENDTFETVFFCGFGSDATPNNYSLWAFDPTLVMLIGFSPFHINLLKDGRYIIQWPRGTKTERFIMGIFPVMKFIE